MTNKIFVMIYTILLSTSQVHAWSFFTKNNSSSDSATNNAPVIGGQRSDTQKLIERKKELDAKVIAGITQCRCRVNNIDNKQQYYPANQQATYYNYINDLKINAGREQTKLRTLIKDWPLDRNTPNDLKALDIKVSEGLRAMSSFCYQPYAAIAGQINAFANKKVVDVNARNCQ